MGNSIHFKFYIGDFETTVYKNQTSTEVWASAIVPLWSEDVSIFHSIEETWDYLTNLDENIVVYYHNLKFDGEFWLSFILTKLKLKQAFIKSPSFKVRFTPSKATFSLMVPRLKVL